MRWSWVCLPTDHFPCSFFPCSVVCHQELTCWQQSLGPHVSWFLIWFGHGRHWQGIREQEEGKSQDRYCFSSFPTTGVSLAMAASALRPQLPPDSLVPLSSNNPTPCALVTYCLLCPSNLGWRWLPVVARLRVPSESPV